MRQRFTPFALSFLLAGAFTWTLPPTANAESSEGAATNSTGEGAPVLPIGALPQVETGTLQFDFGTVAQGTVVKQSFDVKNIGTAPLKIERLHSSCGCTAAIVDSDTVVPGSATAIKVSFDTARFQGPEVKTVRVYTNDPRRSSFVITVQGTVQPDVVANPLRIFFGDVKKGSTPAKSVSLSVAKGASVRMLDAGARSSHLEITTQNLQSADREGQLVTVKLKPDTPVGLFRDRLVIRTTSDRNPVLNIPIIAQIQGDIEVIPSTVSFGLVEGPLAKPLSQEVQLRNGTSKAITIAGVRSDNPSVSGVVKNSAPGVYTLKISVSTELSGAFRARMTITTDSPDPEQQEIVIPVYGIISEKGA